jgi:CheY-like chemotaxis protein
MRIGRSWTILSARFEDGHTVFAAYDVLSAVQLANDLPVIDLVISNTKVQGIDGVGLIVRLRQDRPDLPIIYLANTGRSTAEVEAALRPQAPRFPIA